MQSIRLGVCAILTTLGVLGGIFAGGAAAGGGSINTHFKVAYWDRSGVYLTCNGTHKVLKTGPIVENETCTTPMNQGSYGPFVAGTYQSNGRIFPTQFPTGCGASTPAIPGDPGAQTFWVSDAPGFGACAQFWTLTYTQTTGGGWTLTLNATY